jgi:hypothetical protein
MATPAVIHDVTDEHISHLAAWSKQASDAVRMTGQRTWNIPRPKKWGGDPLNIPDIQKCFNRDPINTSYMDTNKSAEESGPVGDSMVSKIQIDWVAQLERAFCLRHATSVRCAAHASARNMGHSQAQGIYLYGLRNYLQDIMKAAYPSET